MSLTEKTYSDEEKIKIRESVYRRTKKNIDPIKLKETDFYISLVFVYSGAEMEVYSFKKDKRDLFNNVVSSLSGPIVDMVLKKKENKKENR